MLLLLHSESCEELPFFFDSVPQNLTEFTDYKCCVTFPADDKNDEEVQELLNSLREKLKTGKHRILISPTSFCAGDCYQILYTAKELLLTLLDTNDTGLASYSLILDDFEIVYFPGKLLLIHKFITSEIIGFEKFNKLLHVAREIYQHPIAENILVSLEPSTLREIVPKMYDGYSLAELLTQTLPISRVDASKLKRQK